MAKNLTQDEKDKIREKYGVSNADLEQFIKECANEADVKACVTRKAEDTKKDKDDKKLVKRLKEIYEFLKDATQSIIKRFNQSKPKG